MNTSKLLCGLAALTLLTNGAFAAPNAPIPTPTMVSQTGEPAHMLSPTVSAKQKPQVLADAQMDKVTAGLALGDSTSDISDMSVGTITDSMRKSAGSGSISGKSYL